jgi:hypothetical protein
MGIFGKYGSLDELNARLKWLDSEISKLDAIQQALKLIINSFYGAFGNTYFYFYDKEIAASITLQGQDLIKFSVSAINHYMRNFWHKDYEIHKKLGIDSSKLKKIEEDSVIYVDTDSNYVNFDKMAQSLGDQFQGKEWFIDFMIEFIDHRMSGYLDKAFDQYAKSYNTENRQKFKLESISDSAIWVAKKNYVLRPVYDGEAKIKITKPKLQPKGIDLAKPSFPKYARDKIEIITRKLLDVGNKISHEKDIIPNLYEYRKGFALLEVDDMCKNKNLTKYNKYVEDDTVLNIPKGMPINSRSALYHNYLINKTGIHKYRKIREKNKLKMYKAADDRPGYEGMDIFAYIPGQFPKEFAPKVNMNEQFFDVVVEPINKMLDAMELQTINMHLNREVDFILEKNQDKRYPICVMNMDTLDCVEIEEDMFRAFEEMITFGQFKSDFSNETKLRYVEIISMFKQDTCILSVSKINSARKAARLKKEKQRIMKLSADNLRIEYAKIVATKNELMQSISVTESLMNESKAAATAARIAKDKPEHTRLIENGKLIKIDVTRLKNELKEIESKIKYCISAAEKLRKEAIKEELGDDGDDD